MTTPSRSLLLRAGKALVVVACFFAGLTLGCTVLGWIAPFPEVSAISGKLRFFQSKHADSDVIFVGSSRVFHQVIPAEFDAAAAAAGHPVHSFNFGQDGTWPPESFYVLRQILPLHAPRLKWIFIELMSIDGVMRGMPEDTAQARYWHDRHHTNLAEHELLGLSQEPLSVRVPMFWRHEMLWLRRATNHGSGEPWLRSKLWPDKEHTSSPGWMERAGYRPEPEQTLTEELRGHFLASLEKVRPVLAQQKAPLPDAMRAELHALIGEIRARGAEPVFFISPGLNTSMNYAEVPDGARLISFCRPDLYPELYRPEYYYDFVHLNPQGSVVYSELMAKKFVEIVSAQP